MRSKDRSALVVLRAAEQKARLLPGSRWAPSGHSSSNA